MKKYKKTIEDRMFLVNNNILALRNIEKNKPGLLNSACVGQRNPTFFDNNCGELRNVFDYGVPCDELTRMTYDHALGTSNAVKFVVRYKLEEVWGNDVDIFKDIFKILNLTIKIPKKLNDKGTFKNWQFDVYTNIDECINWNVKLKNEGIYFLEKNGQLFPVDDVYNNDWRKEFDLKLGKYIK